MAKTENCCKLKLNEYDEMFTDDVAENTKVTRIVLKPFTAFLIAL